MEVRNAMNVNIVSKRVLVTLPDTVVADLEAWAQYQGRPTANLAAFLIETGIRQAKANNEFKTLEPDQPQSGKGGKS
ncbi:hypothetical protein VB780_16555 [Leptolyngbya sp. CCNP1308]|uniref:ribbon-helix-helix domain-containing protein n=1 Tax=Leptolyngbya sp. CCNP1308 TaxID=3110255 RepID=UPI002B20B089|nr:hypothetical protein [Leptolyngbya sp. CCNP1308]MEA5450193.1 hypothetical protein [Leptolyngbya sp. CCNP1308]